MRRFRDGFALIGGIVAVLLPLLTQGAQASQLEAILVPQFNIGTATFSASKFIELQYSPDSSLAKELNGASERISFYINGAEDANDLAPVISSINKSLLENNNSPVQLTKANLQYNGTIKGTDHYADISLSVKIVPVLSGFVLSDNSGGSSGNILVDMNWRGLILEGPINVKTPYGYIDLNSLGGLLQVRHLSLAKKLLSSPDADDLLSSPVLDFRDIGKTDLNTWSSLFDPSRIIASQINSTDFHAMGDAKVMTVYSYGECSLKQMCPPPNDHDVQVLVDGSQITIHPITTLPNAQIQVAGYSTIKQSGNTQVLSVDLYQGQGGTSEFFPLQVLVILGGMMGAIAIFVLRKARN
jgi:hypothetical protein